MKIKLLITAILLAAPTVADASVVGRGPTGTETSTGATFRDPTSEYRVTYYCAYMQPQYDWAYSRSGRASIVGAAPYIMDGGTPVVMVPRYCRGA